MKKRASKYTLVVKRGSHGLGLFATQNIPRGAFVIEYTGERLSSDEADRRGGRYLFDVDSDLVLDGKSREHTARYINHACKPNCYAERDVEEGRVFIYAKRAIKAGEELSYHYGKDYWQDFIGGADKCACGFCNKKTL